MELKLFRRENPIIISAFLCALSSSLDTLVISLSYGIKKIKIKFYITIIISLITSFFTFISMALGVYIWSVVSRQFIRIIGSVMLILMAVWILIDKFQYSKNKDKDKNIYEEILEDPIKADVDNSGDISAKEAIALSIALSLNNIAVGVISSLAGINIWYTTFFVFIINIASIYIGNAIGNKCLGGIFAKYASSISALIMIFLAIFEFLN